MARPRVFDLDEALQSAMGLFWRDGYEGTSLADLTAAMGITPPSFYHAFGSKDGLFLKVLEAYGELHLAHVEAAAFEPTARGVAEQMLSRMADFYTDPSHPPGCLVVNCALPCAGESTPPVRRRLSVLREARRARLRSRFERAVAEGDLSAHADPETLARFIMVVGWGMAVDAQSGATRDQLRRTVAMALQGFPG
ncbi:MAG: TetR/AcrR family transcriptional regulator [Caulobacteraceae bacterium]